MTNNDVYSMVTNEIIKQLENGIIPWAKPWKCGICGAVSRSTKRPYSLLNQFLLGGKEGEWLTFNQIKDAGGSIKSGEKAHFVVFWKMYSKTTKNENGDEIESVVPVLRYYNVWHIDQCDGVKPKIVLTKDSAETLQPIEKAESVVNTYFERELCKLILEISDQAYYRPSTDEVHMPQMKQFDCIEGYYGTLFHEMTHSTGADCRLKRSGIIEHTRFGSESYSKEELVAELGSAFLLSTIGLSCEKALTNTAAYIQSWLKALKNDKRLIVSAAGKAEIAANYILGVK